MRKYATEGVGTFVLVLGGVGAAVIAGERIGALLLGKLAPRQVPGYVLGQCAGAIVAAGVLLVLAKGAPGGYDAGSAGLGATDAAAPTPLAATRSAPPSWRRWC